MTSHDSAVNDPDTFILLSEEEQAVLLAWIRTSYTASKTVWENHSSYGLKHDFEADHFYITNGQFKGAMRLAGFEPVEPAAMNWHFKIRKSHEA